MGECQDAQSPWQKMTSRRHHPLTLLVKHSPLPNNVPGQLDPILNERPELGGFTRSLAKAMKNRGAGVSGQRLLSSSTTPQSKTRCCQVRCPARLCASWHPRTHSPTSRPRPSSYVFPLLLFLSLCVSRLSVCLSVSVSLSPPEMQGALLLGQDLTLKAPDLRAARDSRALPSLLQWPWAGGWAQSIHPLSRDTLHWLRPKRTRLKAAWVSCPSPLRKDLENWKKEAAHQELPWPQCEDLPLPKDQIPGHDSHRRQTQSFLKHRQERS